MDLASNLLFLVIFGVIGYVLGRIFGINPYTIYSNIAILAFVAPMLGIFFMSINDPANSANYTSMLVVFFSNNIVGILIGDIAGAFIGAITGER